MKNVLVTGSTSGIGWSIARAFNARGDRVMLNGLLNERNAEDILRDFGEQARFHGADMRDPDQIMDLVATTKAEFGGIDILINNAGIQHVSPIEDFTRQRWDEIMAINLSSVFHTTRLCLPMMRDSGWGRIINIASVHGLVASPYKSAYVAAKHGVLGFTKTLALEVAEANITANAICPGYVRTPLVDAQIPATAKARQISEADVIQKVMLDKQPTREFVKTDEIAALAIFLAGPEARSITGAALSIDGGWVAQ